MNPFTVGHGSGKIIDSTQGCQHKRNGKFGRARVVHPNRIAQAHVFRHVLQRGIDADGEKLDNLKVWHLCNELQAVTRTHIYRNIKTHLRKVR